MSTAAKPHQFEAGRDGVERCQQCRVTRTKKGKVIPFAAPCPTRNWKLGLEEVNQYLPPLEALLVDILSPTPPLMAPGRLVR